MVVEEAKVAMGGIGAVATLQEYRGKGFMTKLMNFAIKRMIANRYSLSILWGDRQRYGHFGYETVGKLAIFKLSLRSIKTEVNVNEISFRRFYGESELLNKIITAHEKEPIKTSRDRKTYELLFNIPQLMTYISSTNAYISYMKEGPPKRIIEYGGNGKEVISLIYSLLKTFNREFGIFSVEVLAPYYPYDTFFNLRKACYSWSIVPEAMVKILNMTKLFEEYSPYLEKICEDLKLEASFEIKETSDRVRVSLDHGQVSVEKGGKADLDLSLNEREMVRLLFNGPNEIPLPSKKRALLECFLPLPLHVWLLDHI